MSVAVVLLMVSSVFFAFSLWYRLASPAKSVGGPRYPTAGIMPAGFSEDRSPEAAAFRDVCSRCHNLPGPRMFDRVGWRRTVAKMGRQMTARGILIPEPRIELAVAYLMKHARPMVLSAVPDLTGVEPQVVAAIESAHEALADDLDDAEAWGELGMTYHAHRLYAAAVDCYRHAEALASDDYRWPHLIGVALEGGLDDDIAFRAFERAAELNPADIYALVRLGSLASDADRDDDAKRFFETALAADPDCVAALVPLGELLGRAGDDDAAIVHLEKALTLESGSGLVHAALAAITARRPDGAERSARHARYAAFLPRSVTLPDATLLAVEQRGISFQARINRGEKHAANGQLDEALVQFQTAVTLRPDDAEAQVKLGDVLRLMERFDDARKAFETATRLDPTYAKAFVGLAGVEAPAGRLDAALRAVERAIELEPDLVPAHMVRGQIYSGMNKIYEALASFDRIIELRPEHGPAYIRRGEVLLKLRRHQDALTAFGNAVERRPDMAAGFNGLGVALMALNRPGDAATAFADATLRGDRLTPHVNQIIALRAAGRADDAERALRTAEQRWRDHPLLAQLRAGERMPIRLHMSF